MVIKKRKKDFVGGKKAWIRIVEVFIAILLIIGVLLILLNRGYLGRKDSSNIYETELSILRGVQLNENFRNDILNVSNTSLPVEWDDFDSQGLVDVKIKINEQIPKYLECEAKLCDLGDDCTLSKVVDKEVYAQPVVIAASYLYFDPRQLKLFCWVK